MRVQSLIGQILKPTLAILWGFYCYLDKFWTYFDKFLRIHLLFGRILNLEPILNQILANLFAVGQISTVLSGLAIGSHCCLNWKAIIVFDIKFKLGKDNEDVENGEDVEDNDVKDVEDNDVKDDEESF